jgi:hypothetical protein
MTTTATTAAAGQPESGDEVLEFRTRQHLHVVAMPIVYTALFAALELGIWIKLSDTFWGRFLFALVFFVLAGAWWLRAVKPFTKWFGTRYEVTSKAVIERTGLINREVQHVLITEVGVSKHRQSLIDRIFGSGTIDVLVGEHADHSKTIMLRHIPKVLKREKALLDLIGEVRIPGVGAAETAKKAEETERKVKKILATPTPAPAPAPAAPAVQVNEEEVELQQRHERARQIGESGDFDAAVEILRGVVFDSVRLFGADNVETLGARHSLAFFIGRSGDRAEAARMFTVIVADYTRILGPDHPHTKLARDALTYFQS